MKISTLLTFLLIVIAGPLTAQTLDDLVAEYERAKKLTLTYVEAMPDDKFDYRPADSVRTYAQQMLHSAQGMIGLSANGTGADRIYANENLEQTEKYQSKEEVTRIITEVFDYTIASIKKMDASTFNEIVERGPFKISRINWLNKSHEHLAHHRGQCAIYLRMNGIKPPQYQLF